MCRTAAAATALALTVPANVTAVVHLSGRPSQPVGSGTHHLSS